MRTLHNALAVASLMVAISTGQGSAIGADLEHAPSVAAPLAPTSYSPWTFSFTAYGWLPWLTGQQTIKGRSFDIQVSPDLILQALDWSTLPVWMSYAEARNGKLSLFNDVVYSKLAGSAGFAKSVQGQNAALRLGGSVSADYELAVVEAGAAYEVWSNGSPGARGSTALDLSAGIRYWHQDASMSADLDATLAIGGNTGDLVVRGNRVIARSGSVDWVDPIIGARLRHQFGVGQSLTLRGDIGGFGAGSDFSWQAVGTLDSRMLLPGGCAVDTYLGYRALSVDYSRGEGSTKYQYDVLQHGPVMGATVRF